MCGIAGMVSRTGGSHRDIVDRQLALLAHRGPDAAGIAAFPTAAIGQTRLSVIDLVTGDPPITTDDGQLAAVLNGEIYNFREVRARLMADGHRLHTTGDTEVLPHLAERLEGPALARTIDGMFAFAVWDQRRKHLLLGRDRLGKKPLYYWSSPTEFVFASELKALLAHPAVPCDLDESAIPAYLRMGYVPTPRTFFAGVRSVPPGTVLELGADLVPRLRRYWMPPTPGVGGTVALDLGMADAAGEVRRLLDAAVRRRLVADVPLGAFLSGGVDSSAIVALMAQASAEPVRTFTIGFEDDEGFDERPHAEAVARHYGCEHTEFVVQPDAVSLIDELVWHHDQPFGDSSSIPTYLLSQLTAKHVTVALCGDGGDELFAGYERFAAGQWAARLSALPAPVRTTVAAAAGHIPGAGPLAKVRRLLEAMERGLPDSYRSWIAYISEADVVELLDVDDPWAIDDYVTRWTQTAGARPLDRLLALNLDTYLLDDLLPKVDRMAMAHALEVRAPFLDTDLVEFALRLPPSLKVRGLSLKRVLKQAVIDDLPREIVARPKHGFGVPLDRWFREDLAAYVAATIGSHDASVRRYVRSEVLDRLLAEHAQGRRRHGHALWTLLTLEVFLRTRGW